MYWVVPYFRNNYHLPNLLEEFVTLGGLLGLEPVEVLCLPKSCNDFRLTERFSHSLSWREYLPIVCCVVSTANGVVCLAKWSVYPLIIWNRIGYRQCYDLSKTPILWYTNYHTLLLLDYLCLLNKSNISMLMCLRS